MAFQPKCCYLKIQGALGGEPVTTAFVILHESELEVIGEPLSLPMTVPLRRGWNSIGDVVPVEKVTTRVATMACAETDPEVFELSRSLIDEVVLIEDEEMVSAARWW